MKRCLFTGELTNDENVTWDSISEIPSESCGVHSSTLAANQTHSIVPVTPDCKRESGEIKGRFLTSSLHSISSPPDVDPSPSGIPTSPDGETCETPKDSVFDSFAPGPDKLMLAPHQRKYVKELGTRVVRRLNFALSPTNFIGDSSPETNLETMSDDDEHFVESVYSILLDCIVSEHIKELDAAECPPHVSESCGFRTPKFAAPPISEVSETCPGAPMKFSSKCRNIDKEICKKLEF